MNIGVFLVIIFAAPLHVSRNGVKNRASHYF